MENSLSSRFHRGMFIVQDTTFWGLGVPSTESSSFPIKPLAVLCLSIISLVTFSYPRLVIIAQAAAGLILQSTVITQSS